MLPYRKFLKFVQAMNLRFRILILLAGAFLVVATFTFPYWQPFLTSAIVEETFPGLSADQQMAFEALPADQQMAFVELTATDTAMAVAMVNAALAPLREAPEAEQELPDIQAAQSISSGQFTQMDVVHWAEGTATIYQLADNSRILRFENFRAANGPDLRVLLSASEAPTTTQEVQLRNIDIELGRLKGNLGNQNYIIPAQIDLSQYNSVVIYCRSFGVVFSTAPLN